MNFKVYLRWLQFLYGERHAPLSGVAVTDKNHVPRSGFGMSEGVVNLFSY